MPNYTSATHFLYFLKRYSPLLFVLLLVSCSQLGSPDAEVEASQLEVESTVLSFGDSSAQAAWQKVENVPEFASLNLDLDFEQTHVEAVGSNIGIIVSERDSHNTVMAVVGQAEVALLVRYEFPLDIENEEAYATNVLTGITVNLGVLQNYRVSDDPFLELPENEAKRAALTSKLEPLLASATLSTASVDDCADCSLEKDAHNLALTSWVSSSTDFILFGLGGLGACGVTKNPLICRLAYVSVTKTLGDVIVDTASWRNAQIALANCEERNIGKDCALIPNISEPTPNPLRLEAEAGEIATGSFSFGNDGTADLTYTISPVSATLGYVGPRSGTVTPGGQATIEVDAYCRDVAETRKFTVNITSNDPDEKVKIVEVELECFEPAPDISEITYETLLIEYRTWDRGSFSFTNEGDVELTYTVQENQNNFKLIGSNAREIRGVAAPGEEVKVDFKVYCSAAGPQSKLVGIYSNDPDESYKRVEIELTCYYIHTNNVRIAYIQDNPSGRSPVDADGDGSIESCVAWVTPGLADPVTGAKYYSLDTFYSQPYLTVGSGPFTRCSGLETEEVSAHLKEIHGSLTLANTAAAHYEEHYPLKDNERLRDVHVEMDFRETHYIEYRAYIDSYHHIDPPAQ